MGNAPIIREQALLGEVSGEVGRSLRGAVGHSVRRADEGFTLVELMTVVLIIGILVAIAVPMFIASRANAEKRTCFANQRSIEGMCTIWQQSTGNSVSLLSGVVDASHELMIYFLLRPPRCPSAAPAADYANPTLAEGIYTLDTSGTVQSCTFGGLAPHGHYN